ncbi:hypothetical protein K466DRAFT_75841 [Polyporus arcularius HHB13444]|uniref:Uncharacterized protein n=1 Tax=Polyporus arcularius HHB13444 TaxID=1314778 RepID=A0A5C3NYG9_9APHY|nr:hypothetical protein K466DRAFT_75841 [Polyporus arcularius HHB13444]
MIAGITSAGWTRGVVGTVYTTGARISAVFGSLIRRRYAGHSISCFDDHPLSLVRFGSMVCLPCIEGLLQNTGLEASLRGTSSARTQLLPGRRGLIVLPFRLALRSSIRATSWTNTSAKASGTPTMFYELAEDHPIEIPPPAPALTPPSQSTCTHKYGPVQAIPPPSSTTLPDHHL